MIQGPKIWNALPKNVKKTSFSKFKEYIKLLTGPTSKCKMILSTYEKSLVFRHLRIFEKQSWLFHGGGPYHLETSQLIFTADSLTDFQCSGYPRHKAIVAF